MPPVLPPSLSPPSYSPVISRRSLMALAPPAAGGLLLCAAGRSQGAEIDGDTPGVVPGAAVHPLVSGVAVHPGADVFPEA